MCDERFRFCLIIETRRLEWNSEMFVLTSDPEPHRELHSSSWRLGSAWWWARQTSRRPKGPCLKPEPRQPVHYLARCVCCQEFWLANVCLCGSFDPSCVQPSANEVRFVTALLLNQIFTSDLANVVSPWLWPSRLTGRWLARQPRSVDGRKFHSSNRKTKPRTWYGSCKRSPWHTRTGWLGVKHQVT